MVMECLDVLPWVFFSIGCGIHGDGVALHDFPCDLCIHVFEEAASLCDTCVSSHVDCLRSSRHVFLDFLCDTCVSSHVDCLCCYASASLHLYHFHMLLFAADVVDGDLMLSALCVGCP